MIGIKKIVYLGMVLCFFISCINNDHTEDEILKIPVSFQLDRFDKDFAQAKPAHLSALKAKYPLLFPKAYNDSVWVNKMQDSLQMEIDREVLKKFSDFDSEKEELRHLFQHLKYYFPAFEVPRVITITSQVDFRHNVVLTDSLLLISLDTYLGKDHHFYKGIQRYFSKNFIPSQILPDVAQVYAEKMISKPTKRSFLAYMMYYGKLQYFKECLLNDSSAEVVMGYTEEEEAWAEDNERQIWGYFIEKDLLYDTDPDLRRRFFEKGPFTKFGLKLDHESPAQLGQYMGWHIIKAYAQKHQEMTLSEILKVKSETLFKESNYKPKQK